MRIIIPMAGWGTRLRPHTLTIPKPMLPIAGKPIVQRLVEDLVKSTEQKIEDIIFVIREDFGKAIPEQLLKVAESVGSKGHIRYQDVPLGTAHAISAGRRFFRWQCNCGFCRHAVSCRLQN
jgi:glucose-1-phosphate thymidylyltransferase